MLRRSQGGALVMGFGDGKPLRMRVREKGKGSTGFEVLPLQIACQSSWKVDGIRESKRRGFGCVVGLQNPSHHLSPFSKAYHRQMTARGKGAAVAFHGV